MEFTLELADFVSGERLQELAHVTYFYKMNCNMPEQLKHTKTVLRDKKDFKIEPNENIVYVYGDDLEIFFRETFLSIDKPIKIISHNTDYPVDERYKQYLDSDKIIKWYAQNAILDHPKLIPVPIGIANTQWPHGNPQTFLGTIIKQCKKENLIYKNFDIGTNAGVRNVVNQITNNNKIFMDSKWPHDVYLERVAKSLFVVSPPGNGIDCHRIWESLYLGSVPIVEKSTAFRNFNDLPIWFISDWNEVTVESAKAKIPEFYGKNWDLSKLKLKYWKDLING